MSDELERERCWQCVKCGGRHPGPALELATARCKCGQGKGRWAVSGYGLARDRSAPPLRYGEGVSQVAGQPLNLHKAAWWGRFLIAELRRPVARKEAPHA